MQYERVWKKSRGRKELDNQDDDMGRLGRKISSSNEFSYYCFVVYIDAQLLQFDTGIHVHASAQYKRA
ncbi:hypothetical protein Ancab_033569, partial [Ancistrocladus abbreviatus]